jgi:hypothetical protein
VVILLGGLAFGGVMGLRAVAGGEVGETCSADLGCKPGMRCFRLYGLEKTCTRTCNADAECPAEWGCGEALVVDRSDALASVRQRFCLPGAAPRP